MTEKEMQEIIARVGLEVQKEVKGYEASFKVNDLTAHMKDFIGKKELDAVAWTISYSTAMSAINKIQRPGLDVAWTISYSTAMSNSIQKLE